MKLTGYYSKHSRVFHFFVIPNKEDCQNAHTGLLSLYIFAIGYMSFSPFNSYKVPMRQIVEYVRNPLASPNRFSFVVTVLFIIGLILFCKGRWKHFLVIRLTESAEAQKYDNLNSQKVKVLSAATKNNSFRYANVEHVFKFSKATYMQITSAMFTSLVTSG